MASYNLYLKDKSSVKPTAIYLLFDDGVNRCKIYIQQSIYAKDWKAKTGEASRSLSGYADFNDKLQKIATTCRGIYTSLTKEGKFSTDRLQEEMREYLNQLNGKRTIKGENGEVLTDKFLDFYKKYLRSIERVKGISTLKSHTSTLANLVEFEKYWHRRITFEKVGLGFYYDYIAFNQDVKKHKPNYIGKHIKNIKVVLNEATELKINTNLEFKSRKFVAPSEDVYNIYLNEEELQKIWEHDFSNDKRLENARDLFLIGCWTGLRYSDFSQLTSANYKVIDGRHCVSIKTQKTGDKVDIPLLPPLRAVLQKYEGTRTGFPRNISGQKLNDYLKEIGEAVGFSESILENSTQGKAKVSKQRPKYELMCTHTARRSFATNMYKTGVSTIYIMRITGHRTEKNFLKYIKMSTEETAVKIYDQWEKNTKLKGLK